MSAVLTALLGTMITFGTTALGAATVFCFEKGISSRIQRTFLGFAAGVMIAASIWSLLIPSMTMAAESSMPSWLPAAGGFLLGSFFLCWLDNTIAKLRPRFDQSIMHRRTAMLILAVTLHNIPEGLAVGLALGLANESSAVSLSGAWTLCMGMALQNFPEGAAVSLPLRRDGMSGIKSFMYGALSGAVEPVAGVLGVVIAHLINPAMPWLLAFAAGAMIHVAVEELIPEAIGNQSGHIGTFSVIVGLMLMMVLDTAIG